MSHALHILVGVIGAPHGVRGEVRLKSYTGVPTAIGDYRPLLSEEGRRRFAILAVRPVKDDMLVARFEGVTSREAAAALTNTRLYIERAQLPPADEEEFYQADLIGLRAETAEGLELGRVAAILNFGAGDLLEVRPAEGETRLVPFTRAFVPVVDVAGGRVVVAEGALAGDDQAEPSDGGEPA